MKVLVSGILRERFLLLGELKTGCTGKQTRCDFHNVKVVTGNLFWIHSKYKNMINEHSSTIKQNPVLSGIYEQSDAKMTELIFIS